MSDKELSALEKEIEELKARVRELESLQRRSLINLKCQTLILYGKKL
jgi:hypothetical protein